MSFFGIRFGGGDDQVADSIPETPTTVPNAATGESESNVQAQSFRISSESDGEREMTQEEVNKLVHEALRRARRATSNKEGREDTPLSASSTPTSHKSASTRSPPSRYRLPQTVLASDSDPSQRHTDALLSPTMDSLIGSIGNSHSMMSTNSSDSVLRKVEEEIQAARKAALDTTRRLCTLSAASQSFDQPYEVALSPTAELMDILDDHLADDEDLRTILDTNDDEEQGSVEVHILDDNIFEIAQEEMEAEFADTPTKAPSSVHAVGMPLQDEGPRLRLGYNPEPVTEGNGITLSPQDVIKQTVKPVEPIERVVNEGVGISELSVEAPPIKAAKGQFGDILDEKVLSQSNLDFEEKKVDDSNLINPLSPKNELLKSGTSVEDVKHPEIPVQEGVATEPTAARDDTELIDEEGFEAEDVLIQWRSSEISSTDFERDPQLNPSDESQIGPTLATNPTRSDGDKESAVDKEVATSADLPDDLREETKSDTSLLKDSSSGKQTDSEFTEVTVSDVPRIGSDILVPKEMDDQGPVQEVESAESDYTEETVSDAEESSQMAHEAVSHQDEMKVVEQPRDAPISGEASTPDELVSNFEGDVGGHDADDDSEYTEETVHDEMETDQSPAEPASYLEEVKGLTMSENDAAALTPENSVEEDGVKSRPQTGVPSVLQPVDVVPKISDTYRIPFHSANPTDQQSPHTAKSDSSTLLLAPTTDKLHFRHPYPYPPPLPKPRPASVIIQEHRLGVPEPFTKWFRTTPELEKLFMAARDDSLQRRSNACGALKVLSQKRKNQVALVRTAGFLDSLVFAIAARIPNTLETDIALDARGRAVSTLLNVAEPKGNRQVILAHDGVAACLVKVVNEDLGEARVQACAAIATLAKTPLNREFLATVPGLLDTLALVLLGSIDGEESVGPEDTEDRKGSAEDSVDLDSDDDTTSAGLSNSSSTLEDDGTHDDGTHDDGTHDDGTRDDSTQGDENTHSDDTSTRHDEEHISVGVSSSVSSTQPPEKGRPKQKSIRDEKHDLHDLFLKQARVNACAALMHLSKHCAVSVSLADFSSDIRMSQ